MLPPGRPISSRPASDETRVSDADCLRAVLIAICEELPRQEQRLNELDAALGDGDHGMTITRCCRAIQGEVERMPERSVAEALDGIGNAVVSSAGGATGALLGSAFDAASRALKGDGPIGATEVADMLEAAQRAVASRGRVGPGDKTILDALLPAAAAARRVAEEGGTVAGAVGAAADAAEEGAAATRDMIGRAGRAARLGERSLGHLDPGAVSTSMMLRAAADHLRDGGDR